MSILVVPWKDIFKLSASAAASEFCDWVHVGTDGKAGIPHGNDQVKPHSSPWISASSAPAIVTFFICTNKVNLQNLK